VTATGWPRGGAGPELPRKSSIRYPERQIAVLTANVPSEALAALAAVTGRTMTLGFVAVALGRRRMALFVGLLAFERSALGAE
jgi:hypothetical protein